jgi:cysteine-rich repeat protein
MTIDRSTHTVSSVPFSGQLATFGLAVVFIFAAVACTNAEVETGGNGGTGAGSIGTGGHGAGGGIIIKLDALASTGGTTGCMDTSGCTTTQVAEGCGDGINNQNGIEECDDGNAVPGDGCNGVCKVEVNWDCPKQGKCTRKIQCGNSLLDAGEVCDDGNTLDNDGCNADCTKQDPAYLCIVGQPCKRISMCGDSRIESGEKCDDGNSAAGDGCSASCQLEDGWVCPQPGAACKRAPFCGDGVVQSSIGEVCDDGNTKDNDGCSADCKTKGTGCVCIPGQPCTCPTVKCGNGKVESGEACDDGNTQAGDGCSDTCTIEKGYACPFTNAPCVADCGDGIVLKPMEECDPAGPGTNMDKACSSTCKFNAGWACSSDSPPKCHQTVCGDKIVEGSEGCDDGNTVPNDGCSPTCHSEPDCNATTGQCTSKCGDALIVNEECDDGNTNDGDGCSHDCKVESGFVCKQPPSDAETMTVPSRTVTSNFIILLTLNPALAAAIRLPLAL